MKGGNEKLQLFNKDIIIGDFLPSEYGLGLLAFDYSGDQEDEIGLSVDITSEYLGRSAKANFLDYKYSDVMHPVITLVPLDANGDGIDKMQLRYILVAATKNRFEYKWMKIFDEGYGELLNYRVLLEKISLCKAGDKVIGITLEYMTDSPFAYANERVINKELAYNGSFNVYVYSDDNDDDLSTYTTVTMNGNYGNFKITNNSTGVVTSFTSVSNGETIIMDGNNDVISTSVSGKNILNTFNLNFIKLRNGENNIQVTNACNMEIKYRELRKVGI